MTNKRRAGSFSKVEANRFTAWAAAWYLIPFKARTTSASRMPPCRTATCISYDILDRVTSMTDRSGLPVNMTYDNLGRVRTRQHPDGALEAYGYTANIAGPTSYTNQITNVVLYAYDALGRKTNEVYVGLSTNSFAYSAASDLLSLVDGRGKQTSWVYDSYGRQIQKKNHTGTTILTNGYNPEGRLIARWSLQKGLTSYAYDTVGNATNVNYPASTDLSLAYDRLGRLTNIVDAAGASSFSYNNHGLLLTEDGPWERDTVSMSYSEGMLTGLGIQQPGTRDWLVGYGNDNFRRLWWLTSPAGSFSIGYQAAMGGTNTPSALVQSVTFPNGVVQTNAFDTRGRLLVSHLRNASGVLLNRHDYSYDPAGHRTNQVRWDGSDVGYAYDYMGQLTGAVGRHGSTNRIHEQFTYSYDAGGNLSTRSNNDLKEWFTVDSLNQLTEVLRTNLMTVAGTTSTNASSVAINGSTAGVSLYADATFAKAGLSLSNGTNTFTAVAQDALGRSDTNSVSVWMPTTRALGYDNNGNLITDGLRGFEYDDENQLIRITVTNAWMTEFVYDGLMRCRVRREKTWVSGAWQTASETRYVYHGRLVMQERDGNNQPRVTYTRGPDLSGSLAGAGGIGGLLARTENPPLLAGRTNSHAFYHADAGGNITALTDGTQGVAARYLYDPYGNTISRSGPLAEVNVYRFSSKELHPASGLYAYGYRFYDPNLQRWMNRDPLGEEGGINLYAFVENDPLNSWDAFGLAGNGGPYHPPSGVSLSCYPSDSCGRLSAKMQLLMKMIGSHTGWDRSMPPPRGGGRHSGEIADLWRAYAKCQAIHSAKKCEDPKPPSVWERVFCKVPGSKETWNTIGEGSKMIGLGAGIGVIAISCPGCIPIMIRLPNPILAR